MANEYLTRTPTSTGNQKVFTYSCWIKRNKLSAWARLLSIMNGSTDAIIQLTNVDKLRFRDEVTGPDIDYISSRPLRDVGSWMHVLVAIDTTAIQAEHRIRMYINGDSLIEHGLDTESMPGDRNLDLQFNDKLEHRFFARNNDSEYFLGEAFDLFWVDGQALTPDVFGFNKDGDGYVSVGSTQATDFRPGQWVPKSPRTIKSEINRRGGFGVNGFYLPMNDSSNFGADFHCAPNSIIKLKGEDLPQPRNGAPTTSDNYVSELRSETGSLGFDGVVAFDGAGDYLSIPSSSDFALGTGDWTIEYFAYPTSTTQYQRHFYLIGSSANNIEGIFADGNGISFGKTNVWAPSQVSHPLYRWNHYALVHDSTNMRLYINGSQVLTSTDNFVDENKSLVIGHSNSTFGGYFTGFMSNFRVVKGTALYTSNFTPPTEPLTNVTNTKLLCCNSSTSATAATVTPGTITANGNASATRNELTGSIVLAVPGISTATGANLVTNGTFDTNTSGWTSEASATLSSDNGRLKVLTTNTSYGSAIQVVTGLTIGQRYTFQVDMIYGNASLVSVIDQTAYGGSVNQLSGWQSADYVWRTSFVADATSLKIDFQMASQNNVYGLWDNVILKAEDAPRDYSADIKGSGSNKTLTPNGGAGVGYEIPGYYGSAIRFGGSSDYFNAGSSSDFDFGSGDFTIEYWQNSNSFASTPGLGIWDNVNNQRSWLIYQNSSALPRFYTSVDGTTSVAINATGPTLPTNQWTHICMERNGSNLVGYVNGVCVGINPNLGTQSLFTPADPFLIGKWDTSYYIDGEIQDFRVYKGVAKYKGGFDVPKPYTPVGFEGGSWRQVSDTCKNNFATWNPLLGPQGCALAGGNLTVTSDGANQHKGTRSTMGMSSGKWYWEYRVGTVAVNSYVGVSENMTPNGLSGSHYVLSGQGGNNYVSPNGAFSVTDSSMTTGMIIGCAFDRDASTNQLKVYKNGSLAVTGTSSDLGDGVIYLAHNSFNAAVSDGWEANFGQNPTFSGTVSAGTYTDSNGKGLFKYQPPAGYLALCEDNLPAPAIADPGEHFKTVLYTGTGSPRAVTGVGFKPDFIWCKSRTNTEGHIIFDSIRGPEKRLLAMGTQAEATSTGGVMSFNDDGYSTAQYTGTNQSGQDYVAWCWKAGGAAVTNTDGALTSQVSVNQDAGFSIATYTTPGTATNFGHGLGKKPAFALFKARNDTGNWAVYHQSLGTNTIRLSTDGAQDTSVDAFNNTAPTDTLMYLGTWAGTNNPNINWVSYLWAEIEGYSKFGSYEGSGNADGPFVYCGFKPAWVMAKNIDDTGGRDWGIQDSSRQSRNPCDKQLKANQSEVENSGLAGSTFQIDMLSNGFKVRNNTGIWNNSGQTIIFMAFAESPFQTANAK